MATPTHLYVVGGLDASTRWNDSEIYAYEVATDRWTTLPGPASGVLEGSAAVIQGSLYLFGGTDPGGRLPRSDVVRFDPSTGTWEPRSPMPTARFGTQAIPDGGGTVYVISGWTRRRR